MRGFFDAVEDAAGLWSNLPVSIGVGMERGDTGRATLYATRRGYAVRVTIWLFAPSAEAAATALTASRAGRLAMHPFWAEPLSDRISGGPTIPIYPALAWERLAL